MAWLIEYIETLGERPAIVDRYGAFTYAQLSTAIEGFYQQIEGSIQEGEVVALLADYNYYSVALLLALLKRKAIIVPIVTQNDQEVDLRIKAAACDHLLKLNKEDLSCRKVTRGSDRHPLVAKLIDQRHAGLVLFSSGSTGEPKAMIHDFDHLVDSFAGKRAKSLTLLVFLLFDHIGGEHFVQHAGNGGSAGSAREPQTRLYRGPY